MKTSDGRTIHEGYLKVNAESGQVAVESPNPHGKRFGLMPPKGQVVWCEPAESTTGYFTAEPVVLLKHNEWNERPTVEVYAFGAHEQRVTPRLKLEDWKRVLVAIEGLLA